jgi:hypothetical protein
MNVSPWIKLTWTTVEMQSSRWWRIDNTNQLTGGTTLGHLTWLYARWVPPWRVWFLESSRIFSIWFRVGICFLHRRPPFLASFSCLIPKKHRYTKTHRILSVKPPFYLYISYLCINSCLVDGLKWHFTTVKKLPPHLVFYSSLRKGWITTNITLGQVINVKLFLVIPILWDSMCLPWNFGRLENGTAWDILPFSFSHVNWIFCISFENKT